MYVSRQQLITCICLFLLKDFEPNVFINKKKREEKIVRTIVKTISNNVKIKERNKYKCSRKSILNIDINLPLLFN